MNNLPFVLWMVLFPASSAYYRCLMGGFYRAQKWKYPSEDSTLFAQFVEFLIWLYVGHLLYQP